MNLFETLVMTPNRKYDAIEDRNKRFLVFFVPMIVLMLVVSPLIVLGFGITGALIQLTQIALLLPVLAWRLIYLKVNK